MIAAVCLLPSFFPDSNSEMEEHGETEEGAEIKDSIVTEGSAEREECAETEAISIDLSNYVNELQDLGVYEVIGCGDGTFLVGITLTNNQECTYFNYKPPVTNRGTPVFFAGLYWGEEFEVTQKNNVTHLSIPMRANEYEAYRFRLEVDIDDNADYLKLQNRTLILLEEEDIEINQKMQKDIQEAVPYPVSEMAKYHGFYTDNTWVPEGGKVKESELKEIRMGAYGGDAYALLRLYALEAENDVGADRNALQLAAAKLTDLKVIFDGINENPLLFPIIYEKSVKNLWGGALQEAAETVRTYQEFDFLDSNIVEWNTDESRLSSIPNYDDFFYDYLTTIWGAWELDFNGDGQDELVYFYAGGTMGNEYFEIIHLDKDGLISSVDSGETMRSLDMYEFNGQYYFANWSYDYNDKQSQGVNLFATGEDGILRVGRVYREIKGMRTVISDLYDEDIEPLYDTLSGQLYDYYQLYKNLDGEKSPYAYTPDEQTTDLFEDVGYGGFNYLFLDVDNDGVEEIVGEQRYYPSSAHLQYIYNLWVLKNNEKNLNNLNTLLVGSENRLLQAYPIFYENKYYFLTLQPFGDSQYIFRLQEIADDKAYLLAAWITTIEDQVHVTIGKYE